MMIRYPVYHTTDHPSHPLRLAPIFLAVKHFTYNSIWLVEIYGKDLILDLLLEKPVMEMGINSVNSQWSNATEDIRHNL